MILRHYCKYVAPISRSSLFFPLTEHHWRENKRCYSTNSTKNAQSCVCLYKTCHHNANLLWMVSRALLSDFWMFAMVAYFNKSLLSSDSWWISKSWSVILTVRCLFRSLTLLLAIAYTNKYMHVSFHCDSVQAASQTRWFKMRAWHPISHPA